MKINRLETHDRLQHLKKDQSLNISQGASDCLLKNELSLALQEKSPYIYIFAHPRATDDGRNKRMLWQPRLSKPEAQTNSYLFRAQSKTDILEIIWILPPEEQWEQYKKGNVTEHEDVRVSIHNYLHYKKEMEKPHPDDLSDAVMKEIYRRVIAEHKEHLRMKNMYNKKDIWENTNEW
jgi:hypothetical protein